jgi:hypothetical protein
MTFLNRMSWKTGILLAISFSAISFSQPPKTGGWVGKYPWVKSWFLPNTPDGLMPDQNWHSVGNDPYGDIYVSGMDHSTNSALYRLSQKDDTLRWIGDAKQASTDVNNWQNGETCQKFHMHPTYHDGRIYVASTDRTDIGGDYLNTRGFHWYAYDIFLNKFIDVSAQEPTGAALPHLQIVSITVDPIRNLLYGMSNAVGFVVKHDIAKDTTINLGKPSAWNQQYIYVNRFLWCDSRGRVYISAGNERAQWYAGEDKTIYNNIYYYDVATNQMGKAQGFALQGANSTECGAWNREHTKLYTSDDLGHLYCFDDSAQSWTYLGTPDFAGTIKVWSIQVTPNGKKLFVGRCDNADGYSEFDLATKTSKPFFAVKDLDDKAASFDFLTGYDSWDRDGNFYLAMHTMYDGIPVVLTRANPVQIKVAKGLLPELVLVTAKQTDNSTITISRSGATTNALEVLYDVSGYDEGGKLLKRTFGRSTIMAGQASAMISMSQLETPSAIGIANTVFDVAPDGDQYLAGTDRSFHLVTSKVLPLAEVKAAPHAPFRVKVTGSGAIVELYMQKPAHTRLSIFDLSGKCIAVLADGNLDAGLHEFPVARSQAAGNVSTGMHVAVCKTGADVYSRIVPCY